ncbi:MAG TPA: A24 family peptidase [Chloroflexota bacterium]|nr:A24 family peptidase [Chloroflexota bacterium]
MSARSRQEGAAIATITPELALLSSGAGFLTGALLVFIAPRLVASRYAEEIPLTPAIALVPLLGCLAAGWRPIRGTFTQLLVAGTFLGLAARYGAGARLVLACASCALLILIAYVDLDHRLVLNRLSYPGVVLSVGTAALWPGLGVVNALLGAGAGLLIFGVLELIGRGALGTGDTKLAALIGAMRGLPGVFNALLLGVILGGIGGAFYLFVLRRGRKEYMAYGPYLAAGAILSFLLS